MKGTAIVTGGDVVRRELNFRLGGADVTLPQHSIIGYVIGEEIAVEYHHRRGWKIERIKPEKKTVVTWNKTKPEVRR